MNYVRRLGILISMLEATRPWTVCGEALPEGRTADVIEQTQLDIDKAIFRLEEEREALRHWGEDEDKS